MKRKIIYSTAVIILTCVIALVFLFKVLPDLFEDKQADSATGNQVYSTSTTTESVDEIDGKPIYGASDVNFLIWDGIDLFEAHQKTFEYVAHYAESFTIENYIYILVVKDELKELLFYTFDSYEKAVEPKKLGYIYDEKFEKSVRFLIADLSLGHIYINKDHKILFGDYGSVVYHKGKADSYSYVPAIINKDWYVMEYVPDYPTIPGKYKVVTTAKASE